MSSPHGTSHSLLGPILLQTAAIAILCAMDALIKHLSVTHSTTSVLAVRYVFGFMVAVVVFAIMRPGRPSKVTLRAQFMRSAVTVLAGGFFFYALATLPLADTLALAFTGPLFIALFGRIFLKEPLRPMIVLALVGGFFGVLVIAWGQGLSLDFSDTRFQGAAAAVFSAAAYGLSVVLLRHSAGRDGPVTIVLLQAVFACFFASPLFVYAGVSFAAEALWLYASIGFLGTIGTLMMAYAFRGAPAAELAPIEYTGMLWAILWGYLFFSEVPSLTTMVGAALIVAAALLAARPPKRAGQAVAEAIAKPQP